MCATFDKHFRQPGDPYPKIISYPARSFTAKDMKIVTAASPMSQKPEAC